MLRLNLPSFPKPSPLVEVPGSVVQVKKAGGHMVGKAFRRRERKNKVGRVRGLVS